MEWLFLESVHGFCTSQDASDTSTTPYCKPWGCSVAGNVPFIGEANPVKIIQAIRDLFAGRSNAVGTVTLRTSQTTTTVTALNCGAGSRVFLMPTTANAAAEFGAGSIYVGTVASGSFTITHASNANADKTFFWVALG